MMSEWTYEYDVGAVIWRKISPVPEEAVTSGILIE